MKIKEFLLTEAKIPIKFVRFGDLSKTNYKGFYGSEGQHSPPVKKGIYAFIWPYIEDFLWAWKIKSLHKFDGTEKEYNKEFKKEYKKMRKVFTYSGEIWTHFIDEAMKEGLGLRYKDNWVKIHTDDLEYLFRKYKHQDIKYMMGQLDIFGSKVKPIADPYKRGLGGSMVKDYLEVFIEKIN